MPLNFQVFNLGYVSPQYFYQHIHTSCTACFSTCPKCVCMYASFLLQKAVITNVSPDVLYLFRVQAVCQHDLRSDFSQTLLFRGTWSKPAAIDSLCIFKLFCLSDVIDF